MEIDRSVELAGEPEGVAHRLHRVGVEVGAAAHDVGAGLHGVAQGGPVPRSCHTRQRARRQRDDLEVEEPGEVLAHLLERLDRPNAEVSGDVDVGANGRDAETEVDARGPFGALGDVVDGQARAVGEPGDDGADEIARGVVDPVGGEGLVEVRVRFGRRRKDQVAVEVDRLFARVGCEIADRRDVLVGHPDVDGASVDEPRPAQEQAQRSVGSARRSTGSPRRGKISSTTWCICSSMASRLRPG